MGRYVDGVGGLSVRDMALVPTDPNMRVIQERQKGLELDRFQAEQRRGAVLDRAATLPSFRHASRPLPFDQSKRQGFPDLGIPGAWRDSGVNCIPYNFRWQYDLFRPNLPGQEQEYQVALREAYKLNGNPQVGCNDMYGRRSVKYWDTSGYEESADRQCDNERHFGFMRDEAQRRMNQLGVCLAGNTSCITEQRKWRRQRDDFQRIRDISARFCAEERAAAAERDRGLVLVAGAASKAADSSGAASAGMNALLAANSRRDAVRARAEADAINTFKEMTGGSGASATTRATAAAKASAAADSARADSLRLKDTANRLDSFSEDLKSGVTGGSLDRGAKMTVHESQAEAERNAALEALEACTQSVIASGACSVGDVECILANCGAAVEDAKAAEDKAVDEEKAKEETKKSPGMSTGTMVALAAGAVVLAVVASKALGKK